MVMQAFSKLFGSKNERELRRMGKIADQIGALEEQISALDEAELKAQREKFRDRTLQGESLEEMLPEAFATVREAAKTYRHLSRQRPFVSPLSIPGANGFLYRW